MGTGNSVAVLTATVTPGLYDVAITWTPTSSLSHQSVFGVDDASYNVLGFAYINETVAPNQFSDQGVAWDRLGTYRVTSGEVIHVIACNAFADGQVLPTPYGSRPSVPLPLTTPCWTPCRAARTSRWRAVG